MHKELYHLSFLCCVLASKLEVNVLASDLQLCLQKTETRLPFQPRVIFMYLGFILLTKSCRKTILEKQYIPSG
jgi:hypothetical protein